MSRLPDSFWHTVNRLYEEDGNEVATPALHAWTAFDCGAHAGASKDGNFTGRRSEVK